MEHRKAYVLHRPDGKFLGKVHYNAKSGLSEARVVGFDRARLFNFPHSAEKAKRTGKEVVREVTVTLVLPSD